MARHSTLIEKRGSNLTVSSFVAKSLLLRTWQHQPCSALQTACRYAGTTQASGAKHRPSPALSIGKVRCMIQHLQEALAGACQKPHHCLVILLHEASGNCALGVVAHECQE